MSWIVLQELSGRLMLLKRTGKVKLGGQFVRLSADLEFNKMYEAANGVISPHATVEQEVTEVQGDNSSYVDTNTAQALSHEEIKELKKEVGGKQLIDELVANSKTFQARTQFSQEKYLRKKKAKHLGVFQLLQPTAALIADTLYQHNPGANIRSDALFNLLGLANVHYHSKALVLDELNGVVLGTVAERTSGDLVCLKSPHTQKKALQYFSRKAAFAEATLEELSPEHDAAVLACKSNLSSTLPQVLPLLCPSASIAAFTWDLGDAAAAYQVLLAQEDVTNVSFEEVWTREYQVLPERTHPVMTESAGGTSGGYVLAATKVVPLEVR